MAVISWEGRKGNVQTTKGNIALRIFKPKGMLSYRLEMGEESPTTIKSLACTEDLKQWAEEYFENM